MTTISTTIAKTGLYRRVIGPAWEDVDERVRRLHLSDAIDDVRARGTFFVSRGRNPIARLLLCLLRMPLTNDKATVRLVVRRQGQQEYWSRTFDGVRFQTIQYHGASGRLIERFDSFEIGFRLSVANGGLWYQQETFFLTIGNIRIPLPAWVSPQVFAVEIPGQHPNDAAVTVEVRAPGLGLLLKYEGEIHVEG